jgi:hypothetical protein
MSPLNFFHVAAIERYRKTQSLSFRMRKEEISLFMLRKLSPFGTLSGQE